MYTILYECVQRISRFGANDNVQNAVVDLSPATSHLEGEGLCLESGEEECLVRRRLSLLEDPERRDLWALCDGGESTDSRSLLVVIGLLSGSSESIFANESRVVDCALECTPESAFIRFPASSPLLITALLAPGVAVC